MNRKRPVGNALFDLAIALFLLLIFGMIVINSLCGEESRTEYMALTLLALFVAFAGFLSYRRTMLVLAGMTVISWTAYKLLRYYMYGSQLALLDYAWLPLPLLMASAVSIYARGTDSLTAENAMLRQQVDDLVLIDDLTGLYNQRAMYRDIAMMAHFADRNGLRVSLMIISLRYGEEIRSILSRQKYQRFRQRMAEMLQSSIRLEDRPYALGDDGTLALLLTCDEPGCGVVARRFREQIDQKDAFEGLLDSGIEVTLHIAYKEYRKGEYSDAIAFKQAVESELAFDV